MLNYSLGFICVFDCNRCFCNLYKTAGHLTVYGFIILCMYNGATLLQMYLLKLVTTRNIVIIDTNDSIH